MGKEVEDGWNPSLLGIASFQGRAISFRKCIPQWLFLVPVKGGRWHVIPQLAVHTTYIPLIYCLLGGYMLPTTFYGNQKQPLNTLQVQEIKQFVDDPRVARISIDDSHHQQGAKFFI